jgi:hypothetical protein
MAIWPRVGIGHFWWWLVFVIWFIGGVGNFTDWVGIDFCMTPFSLFSELNHTLHLLVGDTKEPER